MTLIITDPMVAIIASSCRFLVLHSESSLRALVTTESTQKTYYG